MNRPEICYRQLFYTQESTANKIKSIHRAVHKVFFRPRNPSTKNIRMSKLYNLSKKEWLHTSSFFDISTMQFRCLLKISQVAGKHSFRKAEYPNLNMKDVFQIRSKTSLFLERQSFKLDIFFFNPLASISNQTKIKWRFGTQMAALCIFAH